MRFEMKPRMHRRRVISVFFGYRLKENSGTLSTQLQEAFSLNSFFLFSFTLASKQSVVWLIHKANISYINTISLFNYNKSHYSVFLIMISYSGKTRVFTAVLVCFCFLYFLGRFGSNLCTAYRILYYFYLIYGPFIPKIILVFYFGKSSVVSVALAKKR